MKFQTEYTYIEERKHQNTFPWGTHNTEESLTQQSDAQDADINVLLKKYGVHGQLPQVIEKARYGDFSQVTDYSSAVTMLRQADEAFAEVPAKIREEFKNDPAAFFEFATNPDNLEKMREYGLAPPEEKPIIQPLPKDEQRFDDNRGIDETQDLRNSRQEGRGVGDALLPTDRSARTADVSNRSQQSPRK